MNSALTDPIQQLFPADVAVAAGSLSDPVPPLLATERGAVANAVPKRQREFAAGRHHARLALRALNVADQAVPVGDDRGPIWPEGIVGAISHSDSLVAVAAAVQATYFGIGLDLEPSEPLKPDLYRLIAHPDEVAGFGQQITCDAGTVDLGKLVFSIKEAIFKATYPGTRQWLDFVDAKVTFPAPGEFEGHIMVPFQSRRPPALPMAGRWSVVGGHIVAALAVRALPAAARL